ncbi:non-ribosomal peptide synthetase [Nonomuraea aurantiaca]|uniref:non-ribosomal peptide synthetase n=1 Tax=Nonomuraea aurantiaca TaxID=2878562 RepID=UPI001CD94E20|nr:non-ribosomal peptide synthetase [Nonomuraea aurantiaca]MCA2230005.1 amino acid adenylation domain-containing protein [Nonomuraea aurantiaca]
MKPVIEDAYPLAALQSGMLYHGEHQARNAVFHDVVTVTLEGRFDVAALRATLSDLVERHPVLRTSIDLTDFSEPMQLVHTGATVPFQVVDWSEAGDAQNGLREWREAEQFRPYDLAAAPLLRATAHLLPGRAFALSLSFHHAILDGWSVASLITELLRRYAARMEGTALPVEPLSATFRDFVAAERQAVGSPASAEHWRSVVADALSTRLPVLPGYPTGGDVVSDRHVIEFDRSLINRLTATADQLRVPLRTLLLTAHLRVLALLAGESDVMTGVVTHGRPETESGAEIAGLFLNTVPVRVRTDRPTWTELIGAVDDAVVRLMPHRRYPLFEIQRLADRSPLFETAFDFHDFHVYEGLPAQGPVRVLRQDHVETTNIPFTAVFARSPEEAGLTLSYHRTRFPPEQIAAIGEHYLAVLAELTEEPGRDPRLARPLLCGDFDRMTAWSDLAGPPAPPETLHGMVAAWASTTPEADAVVDETGVLSFHELWRRVTALADRLTEVGVSPESVVAVGLPRSADAVVAILAVMQAGGAALPLDLDHPMPRLRELITEAGARTVVTRKETGFEGLDVTIVPIEGAAADTFAAPRSTHPDGIAAVLFTSGSTGRPKGVMLTHRATTQFCSWHARHMGLTGRDRVAQRAPLSVDGTFIELVMAYAVGAAVVIVPTEAVVDADTFTEVFNRYGLTATYLVPSLITLLAQEGAFGRCDRLTAVVSGGETLPRAVVESFAAQSPAKLHNIYGPTELGIAATQWPTEAGDPGAPVPIGRPGPGVVLYVLDDDGEPTPIGTAGEIYVGGDQIARGYLGRAGLTAERFVPDHLSGAVGGRLYRTGDRARWLPDGQLEFAGRRDNQVKIRGVRAELGEIEVRLAEHPAVMQAVAVLSGEELHQRVLIAYVVWSGPREGAAEELRSFCAHRLPPALVPSRFELVDDIPVLPNGKLDRAALPDTVAGPREFLPPRDLVESRLEAMWEEILDVRAVSMRDDFFALGGHSLRALRLVTRIRKEFGHRVPVETLMSHPTIEQLATLLRSPDQLVPADRVVALRASGSRVPIFFVHALGGQVFRYRKLAMLLGEDQPAYGISARGFVDGETPHVTLEAMVEDYARRVRDTRPDGPVVLAGFCVGGNIAIEVARRLRAEGTEVPLVAVFWSQATDAVAPRLSDDVALMASALAGADYDIDHERLAQLSPRERLAAIVEGAGRAGVLDPAVTDLAQAERMLRVYRANVSALLGQTHAPYEGDLALLKPVDDTDFPPEHAHGWDEVVTGKLELVPIPGSRISTAEEPHVPGTAAAFREVLDRVNGGR